MPTNPFDSDDPTLTDIRTRVPGPKGSLPFTPEMLRERPSGDLFGWSQNAGMANRTKVTQQKRARERAKQERQQEKTRRREEAKVRKANEPRQSGDEDPDIAGIIPGPQPSPWGDDDLVGDDEVEK